MHARTYQPDTQRMLLQGAIGGIIAGLVFAMFEMIMSAIMGGSFFGPLRMIAAIAAGPAALEPAYPLVNAILIGVGVHMVMSVIYGVIFGLLMAAMPSLVSSTSNLIIAATIYGFLLWLINFPIIAGTFGIFPWFTMASTPVQVIAHTFFFGTVLGLYLNWALPMRREVV